jgi:hypothetical protein
MASNALQWLPGVLATANRERRRTRSCGSIPKTEKFQTWLIPVSDGHGDVVRTIVRNMMPSPQGTLWLALSGTNGIASVEVK